MLDDSELWRLGLAAGTDDDWSDRQTLLSREPNKSPRKKPSEAGGFLKKFRVNGFVIPKSEHCAAAVRAGFHGENPRIPKFPGLLTVSSVSRRTLWYTYPAGHFVWTGSAL